MSKVYLLPLWLSLVGVVGSLMVSPVAFPMTDTASGQPRTSNESGWQALFNGKDLEGWVPKIKGFPLGENHLDTFQVENGVLRVSYDKYKSFDNKFGHLFYVKQKFSHYRLRVEYRFIGQQCPGGPSWAIRNNGIMFHCQDPKTMRVDQDFPVSIEAQLLGGLGQGQRPTNNVCTPGTHIVLNGKLFTPHCTNSRSKTYHGDVWVTAEIEVHGSDKIRHYVAGELVLEYEKPQLDPKDADAARLLRERDGQVLLHEGYIAIQAESHPTEFRRIDIQVLSR